jgi:hypothetical protein
MLIDCGHIVNSMRYHPIHCVRLKKFGWNIVKVIHDNNILASYDNTGKELFFEMLKDNNDNIFLKANNQTLKQQRCLFKVTLDVQTEGETSNFFEYVETMIYDC